MNRKSKTFSAVVIGGGPAGLRAAEILAAAGIPAEIFDAMPSVGRKFLVAGRGGLNLTHSEPVENFLQRYLDHSERWRDLLRSFSPSDLRTWAANLGVETFIGTSGRVFPMEKKAAPLLRRWVTHLRGQGIGFHLKRRWMGIKRTGDSLELDFRTSEGLPETVKTRVVVLALGGGSWPQTGSDGSWREILLRERIRITPFAPANCGFEIDWKPEFLPEAEGRPIKNITVSAGGKTVAGECLVTRYGIEGGAIYQLGRELRAQDQPQIVLDLKPTFSVDQLVRKLGPGNDEARRARAKTNWKLGPAAAALVQHYGGDGTAEELARHIKNFELKLRGPRPLAEAISTAGGVAWEELDEQLMLKKIPGVFCAGEMIDWEGPTGGYLLQGCFSTGTRAGQGAGSWFQKLTSTSVSEIK